MRLCVINPGVVHALSRTLAISRHFDEIHYFDVIGVNDARELENSGIIYHRGPAPGQRGFGSIRFFRLLKEIAPDVIVCHFASGTHFFLSVLYNRCPVAVIAMGQDVLYDKGDRKVPALERLLIRMCLRRSAYISAKSSHLTERVKRYGCMAPMEVNYWGSNLSVFVPGDKEKSRRKLGLPPGVPIILSSRAVEPRLNIHLIVEAMLTIRAQYPDALLLVLGRTQESYKKQIEALIEEKGLASNVRLIYQVKQDSLVDYYRASDVAVSVAASEGFPNTVLEVMACETPVVVGRIEQIEELLRDGDNARICELQGDSVAKNVLDVLQHPDESRAIAHRARIMVSQMADIEVNGERFARSIKNLMKNHGNRNLPFFSVLPLFVVYYGYLILRRLMSLQ